MPPFSVPDVAEPMIVLALWLSASRIRSPVVLIAIWEFTVPDAVEPIRTKLDVPSLESVAEALLIVIAPDTALLELPAPLPICAMEESPSDSSVRSPLSAMEMSPWARPPGLPGTAA